MSNFKYENILLTGAAGALGDQLREHLSKVCKSLRISDREILNKTFQNEEFIQADLSNENQMLDLTKNIDCVVHMRSEY